MHCCYWRRDGSEFLIRWISATVKSKTKVAIVVVRISIKIVVLVYSGDECVGAIFVEVVWEVVFVTAAAATMT